MKRVFSLMALVAVIALLMLGCQSDSNMVLSPESDSSQYVKPPRVENQVMVTSATFHIWVADANNQTVYVHRITAPWDEMTVTWQNFGGAYDPAVLTSFTPMYYGWSSFDITGLVQDWMNGTYPNYGFLIEQGMTLIQIYFSGSEELRPDLRPKVEICYSNGTCEIIQRGTNGDIADTYIWSGSAATNYGDHPRLYTGELGGREKQSLFFGI